MIKPTEFSSHTLWLTLKREAEETSQVEPILAGLMRESVIGAQNFSNALARLLSLKLESNGCSSVTLYEIFSACLAVNEDIAEAALRDLAAILQRDPAATSCVVPFFFYKGYHALQAHRMAHQLWGEGRTPLAYFLQSRVSEKFGVDIHPAAKLGEGIMLDHATGIVIGETATVGDDVSILHAVTLGGTGSETGDRHPKIGSGVMIGAGAKVLGNITVGDCSRIAAGSVVLQSVPPCVTVAGAPARIVGQAGCDKPASAMDQMLPKEFMAK